MNKDELLQELSEKINSGEISREEIAARLEPSPAAEPRDAARKILTHFSITKILYIIGAAIVIFGVIIFIYQIWDDIGSFGHIAVTLGLGLLITALGSLLSIQKPEQKIGPIFHFIGGMIIPGGALVTLNEFNVSFVNLWPVTFTFGGIFAFYLLLAFYHKDAILTFFSIANGTAFIYLLFEAIVEGPAYRHEDLYAYLTMAVGASYLLLAHSFKNSWNKILIGALYFFGIGSFFGAAFTRVNDSALWQTLYFIFVVAGFFVSIYMKSRIILVISTLALLVHASYITSEYFADSLGWPISLIILGFIFIGLGYSSITIGKKYIS